MTEGVICGLFILLDQVAFINKRELKELTLGCVTLLAGTKEQHLEQHKQRLLYPVYGHFYHPKLVQDAPNNLRRPFSQTFRPFRILTVKLKIPGESMGKSGSRTSVTLKL